MYLTKIKFPPAERETDFFYGIQRTCYDSYYPFQILPKIGFRQIDFEPVTILHGKNGCGKTTVLNVIAEKLGLKRVSPYNKSNFFPDYVNLCQIETEILPPPESCIITSDDIFDHMLDLRSWNDKIDRRRDDLFDEYMDAKYSRFQLQSLEDLEKLKTAHMAKTKTQSKFVRRNLMDNIREKSNGESAFTYFLEKVKENALYLLDEPENSLSAERQLELVKYIEDSARFFNCQFIISTHSPFLLSLRSAKIYDMDEEPVDVKRWTELNNVRTFYDFFRSHAREFEY